MQLSEAVSYLSKQVRPGSIRGSTVSLVAATIGGSTLTIPYIFCISGLIGGIFWIIVGAGLTYYSGTLLVSNLSYLIFKTQIRCCEITGKTGYERISKIAFGGSERWRTAVSVTVLFSLIGFAVTYMTLVGILA